jgi:hypothetical protein
MTRPRDHDSVSVQTPSPTVEPTEYLVRPRGDIWLIQHGGGEYGPYQNRREAVVFAIDAAHKYGRLGRHTHVCLIDQTGRAQTTWTYGTDPYPSVF